MTQRRGRGKKRKGGDARGARRSSEVEAAAKPRGSRRSGSRGRRENSAGGVVFRPGNAAPRFLLICDSYGHWGFPKGHLERGERADTAALREVMEETGLRSVSLVASIATIDWFFRFNGRLIHKTCQFFLMESPTDTTRPQLSEGITECRWTTVDEARRLIAYENAREVLARAHEMLEERAAAGSAASGATD